MIHDNNDMVTKIFTKKTKTKTKTKTKKLNK
jgi:hypothetical protein